MSEHQSGIKERLRSKSDKSTGSTLKSTSSPSSSPLEVCVSTGKTPQSEGKLPSKGNPSNSKLKFTKKGMEKLENLESMLTQLTASVKELKEDNVKITKVETKASSK